MRFLLLAACAAALSACTVLRPKEAFSEAALFVNAPAYVAHRYAPGSMPVELRADLRSAGYACEPVPAGGFICSRAEREAPGCLYDYSVRIGLDTAQASRTRRCAGMISPP